MSDLRISFPKPCQMRWNDMRPAGYDRFCAACSKTVRDLAALTADEAEALLDDPQSHCVRAEVGRDGFVRLKAGAGQTRQKIMLSVGASIGLLASGCATAPHAAVQTGVIAGRVEPSSDIWRVTVTSDSGKTYKARIRPDGTYRFRPLPLGSYSLQFLSSCDTLPEEKITLQAGETSVGLPSETGSCVFIGLAKRVDDNG